MPSSAKLLGERIGRYRVARTLGAGGMGAVYLAFAEGPGNLRRPVAIKKVHDHLASHEEVGQMFLDEAQIASRISHPNVCAIVDLGVDHGAHFLVMEYLRGAPLSAVSKRVHAGIPTKVELRVLAQILIDLCEGLHAAHETSDESGNPLHIVHRDVSPDNVIVTFDGTTKIVDFGIASAESKLHQTQTGTRKGKGSYIAPESVRGERADRRADVWSLGVVAYECLTGKNPFRRDNESATLFATMSEPIPLPSSQCPTAWKSTLELLDHVLMQALQRDVHDRTSSARALAEGLRQWRSAELGEPPVGEVAEQMQALFPGASFEAEQLEETAWMSLTQHTPAARVRRRRIAIALVSTIAACLVVVVGFWLRSSSNVGSSPNATVQVERPEADTPSFRASTKEVAVLDAEASVRVSEVVNNSADAGAPPVTEAVIEPIQVRRRRAPPRRSVAGEGQLALAYVGGWAKIFWRGKLLGQTPQRVTLPAGRQVLLVQPFGKGKKKKVNVYVRPGRVTRLSLD